MTDFNSTGAASSAAEAELGALLAGTPDIVAEAPAIDAAPVTPEAPPAAPDGANVQAAPEAPLTPAAPEGGANTPGASTSPTPLEDPAVKKALGIYGDDPVAAAKGFLETNTRNAQLAQKIRELGYDPKTLQPLPQEQRPQAEQTLDEPVRLEENTVNAGISQLLNQDPDFNKLVTAYEVNHTRISQLEAEGKALDDKIARANFALSIPEIKADTFKVDEYQRELAQAKAERLQLQLEGSILEGKQERLNASARARSEAARSAVVQHYTSQEQTRREEAQLATAQLQARAELATSWPLAIERAIRDAKIPQDLVEDFKEETRLAGLAHLAKEDNGPINDIFGFVNSRARTLMDRYDRYHRSQSAAYGALAQARTAVGTASAPLQTAQPVAETPRPNYPSLLQAQNDLEKEAAVAWKQMFGG